MNDIRLIPTKSGGYDWNFMLNDVDNVIGKQQIVSAIKHAIKLGFHESPLYYYRNKGCEINKYYLMKLNDNTINLLQEYVRATCKEVDKVSDASVTILETEENSLGIELKVILENGEEVWINGI